MRLICSEYQSEDGEVPLLPIRAEEESDKGVYFHARILFRGKTLRAEPLLRFLTSQMGQEMPLL